MVRAESSGGGGGRDLGMQLGLSGCRITQGGALA